MTSVPIPDHRGAFAYRAQTSQGVPVTGTIDAGDADEARFRLASLNLRVFELQPAEGSVKPQRLKTDDFAAFNQQLAQLASAGLPLERGLRLIAQDMRSGRLGRSVHAVADELERGTPLDKAFAMHSARFPALYGKVLEAGVKTGNLPGILLNLGRHMEMMQQLRRGLWRVTAYPLMAFIAFMAMMIFMSLTVVGTMQHIFDDFDTDLPGPTKLVFFLAEWAPYAAAVGLAAVALVILAWKTAQWSGREQAFLDRWVMPLPLIGRVIRTNLVVRWCDAVGMAVDGGMDLPSAMELATESTGSPALRQDTRKLLEAHNAGRPMESLGPMRVLTHTVQAVLEMGRQRGDLAAMMRNLTQIYAGQSEHAVGMTLVVLSPVLLLNLAWMLGFVITALFLPLVKLVQNVSK